MVNEKTACTSDAIYGGGSDYVKSVPMAGMPGMSGGSSSDKDANGKAFATISHMTECTDPIEIKKGDKITLSANYDLITHPL
jgi:hypothetical protein